ncbi:TlpA family protein disulfide reductase [Flavobacterium sp.]|uniref:TlpA family protein disulfide reductase n=1 Tax=Flavobacterium sp. TaxID=239 RepID=UPI0037BED712
MKKWISTALLFLVSITVFGQETMTIQVEIANRNGDVVYLKEGRKNVLEIKVDDKGIFKSTFPIKEGMYQFFDGNEYAQLFLKPGYDLKMSLDAKKFDETLKFSGKGANENTFLAEQSLIDQKMDFDSLLAMEETNFNKAIEEKRNADTGRLDKAALDTNFATLFKNTLEANLSGLKQYHTQIMANKKLNNTAAPDFVYENHKGGKTSLESMKGKYVYIDVWATWCGPCRAEIPFLKELEKNYHGKNIEFVSVSVDVEKDYEKWKTFVTEKALGGTQLYADKNWNSDFIKAFGINSIPRFILIDPKGVVIDADAARPSNPKLKTQLDGLVK